MTLQELDFDVEYRAGKVHQNADTMSRIYRKEVPAVSSNAIFNTAVSLAEVQKQDPSISQFIKWKRCKTTAVNVNRTSLDKEVKCLVNQWDRL